MAVFQQNLFTETDNAKFLLPLIAFGKKLQSRDKFRKHQLVCKQKLKREIGNMVSNFSLALSDLKIVHST